MFTKEDSYFIGYGGVDKFDVTPYFEGKTNSFFNNTTALWIYYSIGKEISISENQANATSIIFIKI